MSSSSTLSPAPADFWDKYHAERAPDATLAPAPPRERQPRLAGPRRRRRPIRAFLRFLITVGIGIGGTLAWQAYGDMARQMVASTYPDQLGWLMPQASSDAAAAATPAAAIPATVGAAAPAPALDQQQLNAISLGLAGLRRSVEELAAQIASGQQQTAGDIARLQASEQDILGKMSTSAPRPAPAAARKPAPAALAPAASAAPAAH